MARVSLRHERESFESLMRRFKKAVDRSGVMQDLRDREFFESPSQRRKKAKAAAVKRWQKKLSDEATELAEIRKGKA